MNLYANLHWRIHTAGNFNAASAGYEIHSFPFPRHRLHVGHLWANSCAEGDSIEAPTDNPRATLTDNPTPKPTAKPTSKATAGPSDDAVYGTDGDGPTAKLTGTGEGNLDLPRSGASVLPLALSTLIRASGGTAILIAAGRRRD